MGLFDSMLKENESLFLDPLPLDIDFIPPVIEGREQEQQHISTTIKPLFQKRPGKQPLITGVPGIGKTVATRYVLSELHKETDDITTLYVNCWKKDTPYKIALDLCDQVGFKFTHNRDTTDLFKEIAKILNKKSAVIVGLLGNILLFLSITFFFNTFSSSVLDYDRAWLLTVSMYSTGPVAVNCRYSVPRPIPVFHALGTVSAAG